MLLILIDQLFSNQQHYLYLSQHTCGFPWWLWFSSVAQLCLTFCDPVNCGMPGFPVHHQLLELAQTHVHRVADAIQPSHPVSSLSSPAFSLSQHHKTLRGKHKQNI